MELESTLIADRSSPGGAGRTVIVASGVAEYGALAREMAGIGAPVPVLPGVATRLLTQAAPATTENTSDGLPAAAVPESAGQWVGTVVVCDEAYAPVAEVLARGSGRALRRGTMADATAAARNGPVTVVAGAASVTPEVLAAVPYDAPIGFLTGRSLASMSALVARTLLHGPTVMATRDDLWFDALADDASGGPDGIGRPDRALARLTGPRLTPSGLRTALRPGIALLAGRGHARDCLMHLHGGGICGRAEEQPRLAVLPEVGAGWSEHPAACQQGDHCWRDDVSVRDHLRAADLNAAFVVLDSCRTAQVGAGSVRTDVSIPLTMLEGAALAVACAVGTRGGSPWAGQLFQSLVRAGLSLGAALAEMNGAIAVDRAGVGRLGLFGDAGLVPAPTAVAPTTVVGDAIGGATVVPSSPTGPAGTVTVRARRAAQLVRGTGLLPADEGGPLVVPRRHGDSSWVVTTAAGRTGGRIDPAPSHLDEAWTTRVRPWLDRLRGLPALGWKIDRTALDGVHRTAVAALRQRAEAEHVAAAVAARVAFDGAVDELARIQSALVEREAEWIGQTFYSATDGWPEPWSSETEPEPSSCPQCSASALIRHRIRPAAGAGPELAYEVCVRCGEVLAGAGACAVTVSTANPPEVRAGTPFTLTVTVTGPADHPVSVAVGAAFQHQERFHCSISGGASFVLPPGGRRVVDFAGLTDSALTIPDQQPIKIILAADGALRCLTRSVWVRS
ncbi:hypothetical protein ACIBF5_18205 [Micromonospora sp. NPDC050417]|uniref:hypothetical protein n=1 Tax=Micromonospora sp. NPDC050417 TaxID=3364280 RepID=UPI00378872E1